MTIDPQTIQALFARAIEIADPTAREKFIIKECGDDAKLYERVANLLIAFDGSKGFLDQPTQAQVSPELDASSRYQPGNLIAGRYKLLEAIGEGGMGTVWVAEQSQPVRRKVALKLVKPGMDSKQVLARFDAERQALALMDHPNIAKVFDGGMTDQGRPFFAMELVKGMPLTQYCDQMRLSVEERLKLFVPICQAVQHAHQKGIIHRDLKPSNVLICLYDGKPVPKVIDFGLAKAMHQPLTEQTVHTGFGLMIGTPLYMSPEQAEHNNLDVDTRSDVYSLGVMLYELLTGSTPLEKVQFKEAAFGEILRLIKEVEPPKPSTRVSSSAQLPNIAAQRNLDPAQLGRSMRGDLDWIVMKALEKDRAGRYETANGLARDIERFLNDEAVEACPPSTAYKLKKLYRKNRAAILTTASFAILLVLGAAGSAWQAIRASQAERIALQAEANAREEQKRAIENEQKAVEAKAAESKALAAESEARSAETEQRAQAELQRDEAQRLQKEAVTRGAQLEKLTQDQRRSIYASEMNLVRLEAQNGNLPRMREILMNQLPIHGDEDLRGFEWNYWYRYLTQAKVLRRFENFRYGEPDSAGAILPGGELVAITEGKDTRVMDIGTGKVLQTIPDQLKVLANRTRFSANGYSIFGTASSNEAFGRWIQGWLKADGLSVYGPNQMKREFTYPVAMFSHVSQSTISEDGRFVAVVGNDVDHKPQAPATRLLVWNIETQKLSLNQVDKREWNRVELNQDGSRLAAYVAHSSREISDELRDVAVVLDVNNGEELQVLRHNDEIDSLNWHPRSDQILLTTLGMSGRNRKELLKWDMKSHAANRLSNETMPRFPITAMRPDGGEIAIASHRTSTIQLINTQNGLLVHTLHNEAANIDSLAYSQDGTHLVALATSGEVLSWALASAEDLFGLRAASVSPVGDFDWTIAGGMERIVFADSTGRVWIRERDGGQIVVKETLVRSQGNSLEFSNDRRLLAALISLDKNRHTLLVYDIPKRSIVWETSLIGDRTGFGKAMRFSPDDTTLLVNLKQQLHRFEVVSGKDATRPSELNEVDGKISRWDMVYSVDKHHLWTGASYLNPKEEKVEFQIRDAVTEEVVASHSGNSGWQSMASGRVIPSPDALTMAVAGQDSLQILDLQQHEQILNFGGNFMADGACFYSRDGRKLIVVESEFAKRLGNSRFTYQRIARVHVVDISSRKKACTISFSGDNAERVKLSFDGKRLLSLHGENPIGVLDMPAKGKLWDAESGRELMTLPVADRNLYGWQIFFDPSNESLLALIFNKTDGTSSEGNSFTFDGTPLPKDQDNKLIAQHLVEHHKKQTAIQSEIELLIQSNTKLEPSVRQLALEIVQKLQLNYDKVAAECLELIQTPHRLQEKYERALKLARALDESKPDQLRSRALMGAAHFRLGQIQTAHDIVKSNAAPIASETPDDFSYEVLRRSVEVLCQDKLAETIVAHRSAIALSDFIHDYSLRTPNSTLAWRNLADEALATQGNDFRAAQMQARPKVSQAASLANSIDYSDHYRRAFETVDTNRDGKISSSDMPTGSDKQNGFWNAYKELDVDRDDKVDLAEFMFSSFVIQSNIATLSQEIFLKADRNKDGRLSLEEAGEELWNGIHAFDKNDDRQIDYAEFLPFYKRASAIGTIGFNISRFELSDQRQILNYALVMYPDEHPLLIHRARLYATSQDENFRNGKQAVIDATACCEASKCSLPDYIETLAAAYAEVGDFTKAVEFQQKAIEKSSNTGRMIKRLKLYESQQPFRESNTDRIAELTSASQTQTPLISSLQLKNAKRVRGGDPCFSADGKQLLYALTAFSPSSYFELLDLTTGSTKVLGRSGLRPSWPIQSNGSIATHRTDKDKREIWLISLDGKDDQKIAEGRRPMWSTNGKLFYNKQSNLNQMQLTSLDADDLNKDKEKIVLQGIFPNLAVSHDGKRIAFSKFGKWYISPLESPSGALGGQATVEDYGVSDWSYDGKYIVFGSTHPTTPGIWLIDAATGQRRLLVADVLAVPRWSPDGKTIAAGILVSQETSNEIVLLDLSSLDLAKAFASE